MTYTIYLREAKAQIVVNELNNGTRIVGEVGEDGYVALEVVIENRIDVLHLYHAGMEAERHSDREWNAIKAVA